MNTRWKTSEKPTNPYQQSGNKNLVRILFLSVVGLLTLVLFQWQQTEKEHELLESKEHTFAQELAEFNEKEKALVKQLKDVLEDKTASDRIRKELESQLRGAKGDDTTKSGATVDDKDLRAMEESVEIVQAKIDGLQKELQRRAKEEVLEKFGPGPHRVKFEIDFHPDEIPEGNGTSFIIEMAPLDLMPYTVNFFLQQVSHGLLNGCSFHRNARHVVQGGPVTNHLNPGANLRKPFKDAELASVAFQEYHPDFPHKKYTLGYAGRPGGPDFYVSTQNNIRNHGPGGQASYAIKSEADPCFAKVVEGFDTVDRMHTLSVQQGGYNRLVHYVAIKSVTILHN